MICQKCHNLAFTVRGICATCAPEIHENHQKASAKVAEMTQRYKAETGKEALSDWYDYESWVEKQPDAEELAAILERSLVGKCTITP